MTKRLTATIVLIFSVTLLLCGCLSQPFAEVTLNSNPSDTQTVEKGNVQPSIPTRKLYVSGAVLNDGYIDAPNLCDYKTVLEIVGITDYTVIPNGYFALVSVDTDSVIFEFLNDGVQYCSVNVNGLLVSLRMEADGVDYAIINKLADYIEANGKITNRSALKSALGEDYADNYYKFYIDVEDYA